MATGISLDKFQHLRVRPVVGTADDTGGKVQFAMGVGVMTQQLVGHLVRAAQRQRRGGGVEVMTTPRPPVGKTVAGIETDEIPS